MERLQTALLLRHEPLITPRKVVDGILWAVAVVIIVALFALGARVF
jgi:hypothetical protein